MTFRPMIAKAQPYLLTILVFVCSQTVWASPVKVVTTTPDVAQLVRLVGGNHVHVESLLDGRANPHFADASPGFVVKVRSADLLAKVGMDLEAGWLPRVIQRSGNRSLQPGEPGHCDLSKGVRALDVPAGPIDRSMGDVHPSGNPHYMISPSRLIDAAKVARDCLTKLAPEQSEVFQSNFDSFAQQMSQLLLKLKASVAQNSVRVIQYHKDFTYLFDDLALPSVDTIEEKPGLSPSAGRLARVAIKAKQSNVGLALGSSYNDRRHLEKFQELSGIPFVQVQTGLTVDALSQTTNTFESMIEAIVGKIATTKQRSVP